MIFSYTKYPIDDDLSSVLGKQFLYRPFIPIEIGHDVHRYQITALLDTGADYTVGPSELAEVLGIDLSDCPSMPMGGIGDGHIETRFANVTMRIGGKSFETCMGFGDFSLVLLGQFGFFEKLRKVSFYYPEKFKLEF